MTIVCKTCNAQLFVTSSEFARLGHCAHRTLMTRPEHDSKPIKQKNNGKMFCFSAERGGACKEKRAGVSAKAGVRSLTIPSNHIYHFIFVRPSVCDEKSCAASCAREEIKNSEQRAREAKEKTRRNKRNMKRVHCCVLSTKRKCHHRSACIHTSLGFRARLISRWYLCA